MGSEESGAEGEPVERKEFKQISVTEATKERFNSTRRIVEVAEDADMTQDDMVNWLLDQVETTDTIETDDVIEEIEA